MPNRNFVSTNMYKQLLTAILILISLTGKSQSKEEWNAKASENIHANNFGAAIRNYTEIINLFPNDTAVYFDRAFVKHLAKDYAGAILDFSHAIELDSSNPDNFYLRGISKMCLRNYAGAQQDFTMALKIEAENADVYYFRGLANNELKEFKKAVQDFSKSIELNSDHSQEAYGNAAWSYAKLHRYKMAKQQCKKARAMKMNAETEAKIAIPKYCWCAFHNKSKHNL